MMHTKLSLKSLILACSVIVISDSIAREKTEFQNDPLNRDKYKHHHIDHAKKTHLTFDHKVKSTGFTFNHVHLRGNHNISTEQLTNYLSRFYNKPTNTQEITDAITSYYHDKGYLLPVASVTHSNGSLKVSIIEGKIRNAEVLIEKGNESILENPLLKKYLDKIESADPAKTNNVEKNVLLIGQIPGYQVTHKIVPITSGEKKHNEVADLIIEIRKNKVNLDITADNYGNKDLGKYQFSAVGEVYNLTKSNDTLLLQAGTSDKPKALKIFTGGYSKILNSYGTSAKALFSYLEDNPASNISSSKNNKSSVVRAEVSQYLFLTDKYSKKLDLGIEYRTIDTFLVNTKTSDYHYVLGFIGGETMYKDPLKGESWFNTYFYHTTSNVSQKKLDPNAPNFDKNFGYLDFDWFRNQELPYGFSAFTHLTWQTSKSSLPLELQIATGGHHVGRGYESGLIHTDEGIGFDAELRYSKDINAKFINSIELFGFYDIVHFKGTTRFNNEYTTSSTSKSTLDAFGGGIRLNFPYSFNGEFEVAQPLDKNLLINGNPIHNKTKYRFLLAKNYKF